MRTPLYPAISCSSLVSFSLLRAARLPAAGRPRDRVLELRSVVARPRARPVELRAGGVCGGGGGDPDGPPFDVRGARLLRGHEQQAERFGYEAVHLIGDLVAFALGLAQLVGRQVHLL